MPDGNSQTFLTAWPTARDLHTPWWLIALTGPALGILLCVIMAATGKLAILLSSMWLSTALCLGSGALLATILSTFSRSSPPLRHKIRGIRSALRQRPSTSFMFINGVCLAVALTTVILVPEEIGLGLTFLGFLLGSFCGANLVDRLGLGWNLPFHLPALFLVPLLQSMEDCVTSPVRTVIGLSLAIFSGGCLPVQNASLAELRHFFDGSARAAATCLWLACGIFALPLHFLSEQTELAALSVVSAEAYAYLGVSACGICILLIVSSIASPHGSVLSQLTSAAGFVTAMVPAYGYMPLPPKAGDWTAEATGCCLMWLAVMFGVAGNRWTAQRIVVTSGGCPRVGSDSCEICIQNDQELFLAGEEEMMQPHENDDEEERLSSSGGDCVKSHSN